MAEEKRNLLGDIKKNIFDVGFKGNITQGDKSRYSIKKDLRSQEYPFRTRPKKKKKADIEKYSDFERLLIETSERIVPDIKKPTKYTSEGFMDAMSVLGMRDPFTQKATIDKLQQQRDSKKFQRRKNNSYLIFYN